MNFIRQPRRHRQVVRVYGLPIVLEDFEVLAYALDVGVSNQFLQDGTEAELVVALAEFVDLLDVCREGIDLVVCSAHVRVQI